MIVKTANEALVLAVEAIEAGRWFSLRPLTFGHWEFRVRDEVWLDGAKGHEHTGGDRADG